MIKDKGHFTTLFLGTTNATLISFDFDRFFQAASNPPFEALLLLFFLFDSFLQKEASKDAKGTGGRCP